MANLNDFECFICFQLAEDAVETVCCHHILCEKCMIAVKSNQCPLCRKKTFSSTPSILARRIIGNIPTICKHKGCNRSLPFSEIKSHEATCDYAEYICPCPGCKFNGAKAVFAEHLLRKHEKDVIGNAEIYFKKQKPVELQDKKEDRIQARMNSYGRQARLGENSKFYCGGPLDGSRCGCCNGECGVTNGCNCGACMMLDVTYRKLPVGWYVNRDGGVTRKSLGTFYCGRRVMTHDFSTDAYCGPTDGHQCNACSILANQLAENAVETVCCHHILCEKCMIAIKSNPCPQCRKKPFSSTPSFLARRMIGNIPTICKHKGCNRSLPLSEIKFHEVTCDYAWYTNLNSGFKTVFHCCPHEVSFCSLGICKKTLLFRIK